MDRKWTVVIELTDHFGELKAACLDPEYIEELIARGFLSCTGVDYQIFEITEAPYGPRHKNEMDRKSTQPS